MTRGFKQNLQYGSGSVAHNYVFATQKEQKGQDLDRTITKQLLVRKLHVEHPCCSCSGGEEMLCEGAVLCESCQLN